MITSALQHDPANALSSLQWFPVKQRTHFTTSYTLSHSLWSNRARCRHWFCQADPPSAWMGFAGLTFKIEASHFWHKKLHFPFFGQPWAGSFGDSHRWCVDPKKLSNKKKDCWRKRNRWKFFLRILPNLVSVGSSDRLESSHFQKLPVFCCPSCDFPKVAAPSAEAAALSWFLLSLRSEKVKVLQMFLLFWKWMVFEVICLVYLILNIHSPYPQIGCFGWFYRGPAWPNCCIHYSGENSSRRLVSGHGERGGASSNSNRWGNDGGNFWSKILISIFNTPDNERLEPPKMAGLDRCFLLFQKGGYFQVPAVRFPGCNHFSIPLFTLYLYIHLPELATYLSLCHISYILYYMSYIMCHISCTNAYHCHYHDSQELSWFIVIIIVIVVVILISTWYISDHII